MSKSRNLFFLLSLGVIFVLALAINYVFEIIIWKLTESEVIEVDDY